MLGSDSLSFPHPIIAFTFIVKCVYCGTNESVPRVLYGRIMQMI